MENDGVRSSGSERSPRAVSDAAALRDAREIVERARADEAAADRARQGYGDGPMPELEPDEGIARLLGPGERSLAVRRSAAVDRRQPAPPPEPIGLAGDLYLTSSRLLLVGRRVLAVELAEVEDVVLAGERLLLVLGKGAGMSLDVDQPRLLRVQIAAARAEARNRAS